MQKKIYLTTPIYYVNDQPHIGHSYTTILADVLRRYYQLWGRETFFLTGTDEHGQKVQQAALKRGLSPREQVDECHLRFKELWQKLGVHYDRFIRTTEKVHYNFVRERLQELYEKGEIYAKDYQGWYSVGEERFFADEELIEGKDPISKAPVEWLEEKNYFFRMGKYQEQLLAHIGSHPEFILPKYRQKEILGFLQKPLQDLCISRPKKRLNWGIPLPFDENFVTYVWFDALLNYQSAVQDKHFSDQSPLWPADYHIIGKDILTTHAVYWPTILLALGSPLPRRILAHGWWLSLEEGEKLSKSSGNAIDPMTYIDRYGADPVRYFLMRSMNLGQDARFSEKLFIERVNTDLANDLGNAINRIHKLMSKHFEAKIPRINPKKLEKEEIALSKLAQSCVKESAVFLGELKLSQLLEGISQLIRESNRYIDKEAPWKLAKEEKERQEGSKLASVLYHAAESLRIALCLLSPVLPQKSREGLALLGYPVEPQKASLSWGLLKGGESLADLPETGLFPRI